MKTHKKYRLVGFWPRAWATMVDSMLCALITMPLLILTLGGHGMGSILPASRATYLLISWVLPAAAVITFWISKMATPGKMLISAVIVDADTGMKPSNAQLIGRYLAFLLALLPLGMGIIWVAFDKKKQGWHDKIARTMVVQMTTLATNHDDTGKTGYD
ncbi:MAG: RDD family protein [Thermodesulfobacteriota bacterium]|nr:RDD family protein [Thermodesulfobacteriota bacterium]